MNHNGKLFAFKLAAKESANQANKVESKELKWDAREGAAVAGCTDYKFTGNLRYNDNGIYC